MRFCFSIFLGFLCSINNSWTKDIDDSFRSNSDLKSANILSGDDILSEVDDEEEIEIDIIDALNEVVNIIAKKSLHKRKEADMIDGALNGILQGLDPYSSYYSPESFKEFSIQTKGNFGGIGVEIIRDYGIFKIVSVMPGAPASLAGIVAGDVILEINRANIHGMSIGQVVQLLRGPVGDVVRLRIDSNGKIKDLRIKRANVTINVVHSAVLDRVNLVLKVTAFNEKIVSKIHSQIQKWLDGLKKLQLTPKGIILDLRDNPGGLLNPAVDLAKLFLPSGKKITTIVEKKAANNQDFLSEKNGSFAKIPIVVLINHSSASASEMLTAALRENRRAVVVGQRSVGKGVMQEVIPIYSIKNAAIRLTVASYLSPQGHPIDRIGILPDIVIPESLKTCYSECRIAFAVPSDNTPIINQDDDHIKAALALLSNPIEYNKIISTPGGVGKENSVSSQEPGSPPVGHLSSHKH